MKIPRCRVWVAYIAIALVFASENKAARAQALPDTIEKIKPSIVGIGTFQETRRPPANFRGTGFVVADGLHIVTNAHVLPERVDTEKKEALSVFSGKADSVEIREATKIAEDRDHDLVILKITGRPLPAAILGESAKEKPTRSPASRSAWFSVSTRLHIERSLSDYFRDHAHCYSPVIQPAVR